MSTASKSESSYRGEFAEPREAEVVASGVLAPSIVGSRYAFRPFTLADVMKLGNIARDCPASMTSIGLPEPYTTEFARILMTVATRENPQTRHWAVVRQGDNHLLGYAGLNHLDMSRRQAELRLWAGSDDAQADLAMHWSRTILRFAFQWINLERVYALQLERHASAGRMLSSIGMQRDGILRKRPRRESPFEDVICWAMRTREWQTIESGGDPRS